MGKIKKPLIYDVIIVGSGPAGIFTALELIKYEIKNILILDRGKTLVKRICPVQKKGVSCQRCTPCASLSGWGGAGAYSDGKLVLSQKIGGRLNGYLNKETLTKLVKYVDKIYLSLGAPEKTFGGNQDEIEKWRLEAGKNDLELIPALIRHMGTELSREILNKIKNGLKGKIKIHLETDVIYLLEKDKKIQGVITKKGEKFLAKFVVAAPGRSGIEWLRQEARRLKLTLGQNPVDVGIRVELPAEVLKDITLSTYEPKLIYYSKAFNDRIRTFCMNPNGKVVPEFTDGVVTVNGHSYNQKKTAFTNFALLVTTDFTYPFNNPTAYGKYLAGLANLLSGGILVQRLGDLKAGRRSTKERMKNNAFQPTLSMAVPGDLSFVLPYRYLINLLEMVSALDKLCPGIDSPHTLLYGIEVKFYSSRWKLNKAFESQIKNLFAIGDGAGITRGLMQASVSGVVVAREIKRRLAKKIKERKQKKESSTEGRKH